MSNSKSLQPRQSDGTFAAHASRTLSAVWQHKFRILLLMLAAAVIVSVCSGLANARNAAATLVLRYEQAYEGLNPNGTRFNIYELLSDEVLNTAIERAGLAQEVSADALLDSITVSASGSQSARNMYIATEYTVRLNGRCLPQRISAESMLGLLMETYKQYFLENYGTNDSALDIDWSDADKWEYLEFASIMDVKVNNLITYLDGLRAESGMSQYRISGETFRSLSESISNFREIYLNRYTSYVTVNHLFRNVPAYQNKLAYRRFLAEQDRDRSEERYAIYRDALNMYDESMITFVMVPMYDSATGLYMARTSVGMDTLTDSAKACAEQLEVSAGTLKGFDSELLSASAASSDPAKHETAERMIADIQQHMDGLIARIRQAKRDYENYRSKDSISYSLQEKSFIEDCNVKAALAAALGMLLLCVLFFAVRTNERREKKI